MRSVQIVESFLFTQFFLQVNVAFICQQLIELFLIGPVGSLDLTVKLRTSRLDVNMSDPLVFDMPVELGLPLMAAVGAKGLDAEGKLLDDVVGEMDRVLLRMALVDLQRPYPSRIIDSCILVTLGLLAA